MKRLHIILCVLSVVVSFSAGDRGHASISKQVPLFTLNDFRGEAHSLESLRGNVVLINFWATWCAPCVEEMPALQALKDILSDQPFEILAINMGEDASAISAFIDRIGIEFTFPFLVDPQTEVAEIYRVSALPASLIVDKRGNFGFGGVGARAWNSPEVIAEIRPYLVR